MSYSTDQLADFEARILDVLRSGPVARTDLPGRVPGLTDYLAVKLLKPLIRRGTVRVRSERRERIHRAPFNGHTSQTVSVTVYHFNKGESQSCTRTR